MIIPESYQDRVDYFLMVLVVLAAIIRFWQLGTECLWIDEAWSYFISQQPWHLIPYMDVHPPVYYWFMKTWLLVAGYVDEAQIRMVSALFGIACVPATFMLGKRIGNDFVGMVAAFLMTFSTFAVYYSQEARQYTMVTFFFCVFMLAYLSAMEHKGWKRWAIAGGLAALCIWTHWFMFFAIAITVLHAISFHRKEPANVFIYVCSIFALMLPAIPSLDKAIYTKTVLEGSNLLDGLHGMDIISETVKWAGQGWLDLGILLVLLALIGWIFLYYQEKNGEGSLLFVSLFIGYTAAMVVLAEIMVVFPRYFLFLMPLYYILVAIGLINIITSVTDNRTIIALIMVLFIAVFGAFVFTYYEPTYKPDFRHTYDGIYPLTSDGDVHAITANQGQFTLVQFYYGNYWDKTDMKRFSSVNDLWDIMQEHEGHSMFVWVPPDEVPDGLAEAARIDKFLKQYGEKVAEVHQGTIHYAIYKVPYMREPFVSPPPLKSEYEIIVQRGIQT